MEGRKRSRKKASIVDEDNQAKKSKAEAKEEQDIPSTSPNASPVKDESINDLRNKISEWIEGQRQYEDMANTSLGKALEDGENSDGNDLPEDFMADLEIPLAKILRNRSDHEKRKSFKYECEWRHCSYMSGKDRKYFQHVEEHGDTLEPDDQGTYSCEWDLCDFVTEDRDELIGHVHYHGYHTKLKVHGASLSLLMRIPNCTNDSRLRNSISNRPVNFRCEWGDCDERFNKAMHFFQHTFDHVSDNFEPGSKSCNPPMVCQWSLCKLKFRHRFLAYRHVQTHTTQRELACFLCGAMFCGRTKYVDHCSRQLEMPYRKYECEECGKYYATERLLNNHLDSHKKDFPCTLCPLAFSSNGLLSRHMLHRHMKQRNFQCTQCDFKTFTNTGLMVHIRSHSDIKVYRCEEFGCNVAFKSEASLRRHISWHYNIPPPVYGCHLCDKTFVQYNFPLSKHLHFVHGVERQPGRRIFRYKADTDGVYRLSTYVESKMKEARQKAKEESALEAGDSPEKTSDSGTVPTQAPQNAEHETDSNQTIVPVKGQPKISSITCLGSNEFSIKLDIDPEPEAAAKVAQQEQGSEEAEERPATSRLKAKKQKKQDRVGSTEKVPPSSSSVGVREKRESTAAKDVQNFMVMKRYLGSNQKGSKT